MDLGRKCCLSAATRVSAQECQRKDAMLFPARFHFLGEIATGSANPNGGMPIADVSSCKTTLAEFRPAIDRL